VPSELSAEEREFGERSERPNDPLFSCAGEVVGADQLREILNRRWGDDDAGHGLELLERHSEPSMRLLPPELRTLECIADPVEQRGDVARIGIGVVEGRRKECSGERPLVRLGSLCEPLQLQCVLLIEAHVDLARRPGLRIHGQKYSTV